MREAGYLAVAVAAGYTPTEYRHETGRAAKAEMGKRGLGARIDNNHSG